MDFMSITGRMLSLFLIMIVGYVMNKAKVIDEAANVRYTKLVLNITVPAQIITSFVSSRGVVPFGEVFSGFGLSIAVFALYFILAALFLAILRIPKEQKGTYAFMSLFSNVGFMGYPVITAVFGEEAMIYAVILNVVFNMIVYSVGIVLISGGAGGFHFNPRLLLNMPLLSSVLSILLYFAGVSFPEPVMTSLEYLGNVTTPVAMLVLGSTIAQMPVKELFDDWRVYIFTVFRLIAIPLAVWLFLGRIPVGAELMKGTLIILSAMPVATNTTMLAIEYHGDVRLASRGIFFTTVLSVITIPFIAMLC